LYTDTKEYSRSSALFLFDYLKYHYLVLELNVARAQVFQLFSEVEFFLQQKQALRRIAQAIQRHLQDRKVKRGKGVGKDICWLEKDGRTKNVLCTCEYYKEVVQTRHAVVQTTLMKV